MNALTRPSARLVRAFVQSLCVVADTHFATNVSFAQSCAAGAPVAFVGADVLTMRDSILLRNQTVLVQAEKIAAIGNPTLPADVCRIDARQKTLLPGLADMHAHMSEVDLPIFLSNGITLVREMNGSPTHLALRAKLAHGEVLGPRLIVASPLMTGKKLQYRHQLISSKDDAFAAAHAAKEAGYDFLKIYDDLSLESYQAFVEAGRALKLPLDGHIPQAVGLERVLAAGQSIQHMDKIAFALAGHTGDTTKLSEAMRLFSGKHAWVTPTLASLRALDIAGTAEYAGRFRQPEIMYVDSGSIGWWKSLASTGDRVYAPSNFYQFERKLLPVLQAAGVRFLLGTDASNPLMIAGFSVHEELALLIRDGGFTPFDALAAATRNPAEFLGDANAGVVRNGAHADLILVSGNPLQDMRVLKQPIGVMVGGRWIARAELDAGLKLAVQSAPAR